MPNILEESEVDTLMEEVDAKMTMAEEQEANQRFAPTPNPGDLSNGGMVGGARLTPMIGGRKVARGRPAARRAWMWNGTESLLPLAWNPEGTRHDGARHYLLKRHCLCCNAGGFSGRQCPSCVKSNCDRCGASTDRTKIIANFYLRKEDVPFPSKFYGSIPCFLEFCPRQDGKGFLTQQDMRVHASTRHRMEYRAYIEAQQAERTDELGKLREQVATLMMNQAQATNSAASESAKKASETRRRRAAATT